MEKKIYQGEGFIVVDVDGMLKLSFLSGGHTDVELYYDLTEENFEKLKKSKKDLLEVIHYCRFGVWPPSEEEQLESDREFVRDNLDLFLRIPGNQELFDEEEREKLFREARKMILTSDEFQEEFNEVELKKQMAEAQKMLIADPEFKKMFDVSNIANVVIEALKATFEDGVEDIHLFDVIEEPAQFRRFSITFKIYNYFNMQFDFDRGSIGVCISFGKYGVGVPVSYEWISQVDKFENFWEEVKEDIRLRIPDKYLEKHGYA